MTFPNLKNNKFHYGWVILASVMALSIINASIRQTFGVLIDPLVELFGWKRGDISLAYSIAFLAIIPSTFIVGRLAETISPRKLMRFGSFTIGLSLILIGTVTQLWQLYLYYGVILAGLGSVIFATLNPVIITRWFNKKTGLAIGLMWGAMGFGPMVMAPLLRWSVENNSWQNTFLVYGVAMGTAIFIISFIIYGRPEEAGLSAYGVESENQKENKSTIPVDPAISISKARSTVSFWALILIHFFGCVSHSLMLAHMVSMATFNGISSGPAAAMLSIVSAVTIASRFVMSIVASNKGSRFTLGAAMLLQTTPIFIMLWAQSLWGFYLFAFFFGIGYGGEMVGFPIFNRQFYGVNSPLSVIYSYQIAGATLGMALGSWLGGALFDFTGDYFWSIMTAIIVGYIGLIPVFVLPRHARN